MARAKKNRVWHMCEAEVEEAPAMIRISAVYWSTTGGISSLTGCIIWSSSKANLISCCRTYEKIM
jgi:hypothetical protein